VLEQELYTMRDLRLARSLIEAFGWAILASAGEGGDPVVSHLPLLLDHEPRDGAGAPLSVVSHVANADAELHHLGTSHSLVVVQGPNGYISPAWYGPGSWVPTWNYVTVHLHGTCQLLDPEETFEVLGRTVEHYERQYGSGWRLAGSEGYARRIAGGITGFRLQAERVVLKAKLSQDKPPGVASAVIEELERSGRPHAPLLASWMRLGQQPRHADGATEVAPDEAGAPPG